ncbi:MAG: SprT family zinc-dependent metalloprotease [Mariprofundaceae bacterium]|nr:SprT family zinc-dependent metalloprotease [Mariprofundaceae bacterium]
MNQTLPIYQVRISKRAKYARLVMQRNGMLEVVLPVRMNHDDAEHLVRSQKDWIAKHQQGMQNQQAGSLAVDVLPNRIHFPSLNQVITVKYISHEKDFHQENDGELTVYSSNDAFIPQILQHWLKDRAEMCLSSMLFAIAQEMDETYQSVSIRLQKTRWGSCSNQRRINLNAKLLLLPQDLMRYVMIHELSHLQHLNHSKEFWQRVAQFEPDYAEKRQTLRVWEENTPDW